MVVGPVNVNGIEYWNKGWEKSDSWTKRSNGVNRILQSEYGISKDKQGPRRMEPK